MRDKQIEKLIKAESVRQKKVINLIASENYVSEDVLETLGSVLTNKYAEGYSGKRYYGGNMIIDKVEDLCVSRALKLFKLKPEEWHVNVQALSGSPANLSVFFALMPPPAGNLPVASAGDTKAEPAKEITSRVMGMSLDHGGHLTHGQKVSATGKLWNQVPYGVSRETETLDYEEIKKIAQKERPNMIISGFTAYPRIIDWKKFKDIANSIGAYLVVDMSHIAGLVAGGVYPSPFPYADVVTTTTHKTLRGPRGALIFSKIDDREIWKKIDKAVFPGLQGGPHMNQIAATAVALKEADTPAFKKYAKQVVKNAEALSYELSKLGWRIISRGTDSHLLLVDVFGTTGMGGKEASERLEKAGIIVNKNAIPFDTRPPTDPSGIRLGSAAETTRGKKEKDFVTIARKIDKILRKK